MGKASSTKKVQRIARAGGGRKAPSRSAGSMLWPALVTIVVLAGVGLIAFSRNQNVSRGAGPHPRIGDHVHDAFGIYDCNKFLGNLQDAKQDVLGIHTHGDGRHHDTDHGRDTVVLFAAILLAADQRAVRAVVLVGGRGTRLQPLTDTIPKQLLPVAGTPMIERVVAHLVVHGVDDVVLSMA